MPRQRIFAQKWNKLYLKGVEYQPLNEIFLNLLLSKIKNMTGVFPRTVVDLGCGAGDAMVKLSKAGLEVTGIDYSSVALKKAKARNVKAKWLCKDLEKVSAVKNKVNFFDFLLCKLIIAFIKDKERFLSTIKSMMGPKSVFCVITPVLHEGVQYVADDKPKIAVQYGEFMKLIQGYFKTVIEFHHNYLGERGDIATFLMMK